MPTLLVVDDESNVLYSLQSSLQTDQLRVITAATARQGIDLVRSQQPDAVILDVRLPDISGLEAFDQIRAIDQRLPIIVVTAYTTTETAIEAMRRGAFEYLLKPVDLRQLRETVHKAIEVSRLSRVPAVFGESSEPESVSADRIVGMSPIMQDVYKAIGRVAPQEVPVLIQGESGTGKELIARAIFHYSQRSHMPFMVVHCGAVSDAAIEAELFGQEGALLTGDDRHRTGKFEQAQGGTIFLDEIANLSTAVQTKVLRVLQEQSFERVGSNAPIRTDIRIVAATTRHLEPLVAAGRFRQDLLYRLNTFTIQLPPLRERPGDLQLLVDHFIKVFNRQLGRHVRMVTPQAFRLLEGYAWPGNVRELQSAVKFAMVQTSGDVLTVDCLPESLRPAAPPAPPSSAARMPQPSTSARAAVADEQLEVTHLVRKCLRENRGDVYRAVHGEVDRVMFDEVLRHVRGNQLEAAEILGISRTTLRAKLRSLGLAVEKQLSSDTSGTNDAVMPAI